MKMETVEIMPHPERVDQILAQIPRTRPLIRYVVDVCLMGLVSYPGSKDSAELLVALVQAKHWDTAEVVAKVPKNYLLLFSISRYLFFNPNKIHLLLLLSLCVLAYST